MQYNKSVESEVFDILRIQAKKKEIKTHIVAVGSVTSIDYLKRLENKICNFNVIGSNPLFIFLIHS